MKKVTSLLIIVSLLGLSGCSLLHHQDAFEMERLSEDVLGQKGSSGISIEIMKIPSKP